MNRAGLFFENRSAEIWWTVYREFGGRGIGLREKERHIYREYPQSGFTELWGQRLFSVYSDSPPIFNDKIISPKNALFMKYDDQNNNSNDNKTIAVNSVATCNRYIQINIYAYYATRVPFTRAYRLLACLSIPKHADVRRE